MYTNYLYIVMHWLGLCFTKLHGVRVVPEHLVDPAPCHRLNLWWTELRRKYWSSDRGTLGRVWQTIWRILAVQSCCGADRRISYSPSTSITGTQSISQITSFRRISRLLGPSCLVPTFFRPSGWFCLRFPHQICGMVVRSCPIRIVIYIDISIRGKKGDFGQDP